VLRTTTITPLERRQTSAWRSSDVDAHAGTLDSPSGRLFSTHAGVYGLRWWGDENSVLVVQSNFGAFERVWVNEDYEHPQEYWITTNFQPFVPAAGVTRFPESIYEVRSVDIGECSTGARFDDPTNPNGALAQMIDQGIADAIRDSGGPWTHVDLQEGRASHFEVRLRELPEDVGDFPATGLLTDDDFCFDGHYQVSRVGLNGRCNVGGFSLHFCGRPTIDSRWEDFDGSGLPVGEVAAVSRVQRGDFDFALTESLEVHQDYVGDGCNLGGLPSSDSLAERFTRNVPPKIAQALNDQTWQDSAPESLAGIDLCPYRRRHPDWADLEARSHCANALHVQVDRVRCGDQRAEGITGDCEFRAEPDRVAFLGSAMTIVLAECGGTPQREGPELPSRACHLPDPQSFLFRLAGACGHRRIADANAVRLSFDISPTVSAH